MSVDLQSDLDVDDLGRTLGRAIRELPEYEAFEAAEEAVKASDRAQERIEAFEEQRESFMLARQLGEATQEDVGELRSLQQELHELPVMQEYLEAQDALDRRLVEVNEAISQGLAVDFADAAGSCCHD